MIPAFFGLKKADKFPVSGYETVKKPREAMCGKNSDEIGLNRQPRSKLEPARRAGSTVAFYHPCKSPTGLLWGQIQARDEKSRVEADRLVLGQLWPTVAHQVRKLICLCFGGRLVHLCRGVLHPRIPLVPCHCLAIRLPAESISLRTYDALLCDMTLFCLI